MIKCFLLFLILLQSGLQAGGSYYSQVEIESRSWPDDRVLSGTEVFVNGRFAGETPLRLNQFCQADQNEKLLLRHRNYFDIQEIELNLPAEGRMEFYLASRRAASWYTLPAFVVGLVLSGAALAVWESKGENTAGMSLLGAAVISISFSQIYARFWDLPVKKEEADKKNRRKDLF